MTAVLTYNSLTDAHTGQAIDLAMQSLSLTGRVYPIGAFVRVIHRFKCLGTKPLEAIYVFQLPENGTLRRFKVFGDSFFQAGFRLEKRKAAREEYEQGVEDGHLSVLAETNSDGVVSLSVGQVRPDEEISVVMDIVVGVTTRDTGFTFRFPFTLAPNYHPQARVTGNSIELPENVFGDMTLPEWGHSGYGLHAVTFDLQVFPGTEMATVSSPSHRITVAPQTDGSKRITLAGLGDEPNRDLVLNMSVPKAEPVLFADATLLGYTPSSDAPEIPVGAPRWTAVIPSTILPKSTVQARKICFLIDRSGSMAHGPLDQAKQAFLGCLAALNPSDEFGVVAFDTTTNSLAPNLLPATDENRDKARQWLAGVHPNGGTEMLHGLAAATRVLGEPGDIFLFTDGQVWGTGPIIEHMGLSGSRVHVLGIGTAAQHRFMSQLARRTGGVSDMVSPSEDVALSGVKLFNQVQEPVLLNATAKVDGVDIPNIGTVWQDHPVILTDPKGDGSLPGTLMVMGGGTKTALTQKWADVQVPDGLVALLEAGRRIEYLSSKMDLATGENRQRIETRMEEVSVAYGLASKVMSLVAVVTRLDDKAGVTPEQKVVPVGMPEGQAWEGVFGNPYGGMQVNTVSLRNITRRRSAPPGQMYPIADFTPYGANLNASLSSGGPQSSMGFLPTEDAERYTTASWIVSGTSSAGEVKTDGMVVQDSFFTIPKNTGSQLLDLSTIQADGGLKGATLKERVYRTLVFAGLLLHKMQEQPGVYDKHFERVKGFLAQHDISRGWAKKISLDQPDPFSVKDVEGLLTAPERDLAEAVEEWARD